MNRRPIGWVVACLTLTACGGSSVTVSGPGPDGKTYVMSQGGSLPPVEAVVGEKGIEPAPTATPGQPTPVHPIDTPAPPATPVPFSTPRPS
ncbi:MAG: hypothetical protein ACM3NW_08310 [Syntrophomonadaceae bacterium]